MDNYFNQCPPRLSDGRHLCDYRSSTVREQQNKALLGVPRDDDYRLALQRNGATIRNATWDALKKNESCHTYLCFHNAPQTRVPNQYNIGEMHDYNAVRTNKMSGQPFVCQNMPDYRATY